jgi:hypothetical protein
MLPDETIEEVLEHLRSAINDSIAAEAFASMGLTFLPEVFRRVPPVPENPDPTIYIGVGDPNLPSSEQYAQWPLSKALQQVAPEGPVTARLGQQWIVFVYTLWEHEYRKRLAAAHGCAVRDVKYPLLGDIRLLRNDVVHHSGVATPENAGKCQVVHHWFRPGELMHLRGEHFAEFVRVFPWPLMAAGPQ